MPVSRQNVEGQWHVHKAGYKASSHHISNGSARSHQMTPSGPVEMQYWDLVFGWFCLFLLGLIYFIFTICTFYFTNFKQLSTFQICVLDTVGAV